MDSEVGAEAEVWFVKSAKPKPDYQLGNGLAQRGDESCAGHYSSALNHGLEF